MAIVNFKGEKMVIGVSEEICRAGSDRLLKIPDFTNDINRKRVLFLFLNCFCFCLFVCCLLLFGCWLLVVGCWLYVVLFCFVLFCFVLFCFVLFCFVLFCFLPAFRKLKKRNKKNLFRIGRGNHLDQLFHSFDVLLSDEGCQHRKKLVDVVMGVANHQESDFNLC